MKINQPKFKMRKPIGLTLDFLDTQQAQKEQSAKKQDIETFEEFCSQMPENQQQLQDINFSKQSQSFQSQQIKSERNQRDESSCSEIKQSIENKNQDKEESAIQYIVFEEFNPQSTVISVQSESQQQSEKRENKNDIVNEPPAPCNKNNTRFNFPSQKINGLTGLKKHLQIAIPEVEQTNGSSYEQTMIKQQVKQNQNSNIDMELKQQIFSLQRDKEQIKNQYKLEIIELNAKIQELQQKLDIEQVNHLKLKQENDKLQFKISQFEHQHSVNIDRNQSEQISVSYPNKMNDNEKIQYLIDKLNQKSQQNAKLQYEIFKLQNNIEILQTKQIISSYNINPISDNEQISESHSPPHFNPMINSKNRESKSSLLLQQKQALLNLSATQKFKEALNSKLQNVPDKHKSYASLLFSLGDFNKSKGQDAYIRQISPHEDQLKQRMFAYQVHPNSRKQSETIKSEESHKVDQTKFDSNCQRKGTFSSALDILQLMRNIKTQKMGISTKMNYKKTHSNLKGAYTECQSSRSNHCE